MYLEIGKLCILTFWRGCFYIRLERCAQQKNNKGKFYCTTWLFSFLQFASFEKGYAFLEKSWLFTVEQGFVKIRQRWRICNVCKKKSFKSKVCKVHFFATCELWYSVFLFKMRRSFVCLSSGKKWQGFIFHWQNTGCK